MRPPHNMGVASVALEDEARRGPVGRAVDLQSPEPRPDWRSRELSPPPFAPLPGSGGRARPGARSRSDSGPPSHPVLEVREDVLERHANQRLPLICDRGCHLGSPWPPLQSRYRCRQAPGREKYSHIFAHRITRSGRKIIMISPNNVPRASLTEAQLILAQATA